SGPGQPSMTAAPSSSSCAWVTRPSSSVKRSPDSLKPNAAASQSIAEPTSSYEIIGIARCATRVSDTVFEALRFRQRLELLERVVLDLADALAGDAERAPDLLERARLRAGEPEAKLDHLPVALRQRGEGILDVLTT